MADKIGVLGEATTLTAATTAVYTVGASKAAKGQVMFYVQGATGATTDFTVNINGVPVAMTSNIAASQYIFSSTTALTEGPQAAVPNGQAAATTVAPGPGIYYLSAADVVSYTLAGSDALVCNVQFVGTEIDV